MKALKIVFIVFAIIASYSLNAQVAVTTDGSSADGSAMLEVKSTDKGLLLPRMTTAERNAIISPANSLLIFNTTTKCFEAYNATSSTWVNFGCIGINTACGSTLTINHTTDKGVAPVDKTVTYGTVSSNLSGATKCWITRNLGATNQASTTVSYNGVNDPTDESAGWYWHFNRKQGYEVVGTTRTPNTWVTSISENSDWILANDPCAIELGTGWRIPSGTEWENANSNGAWKDRTNPYNSELKLHAAGYLSTSNGSLKIRGEYGYYWSSTKHSNSEGKYLVFNSSTIDANGKIINSNVGFNSNQFGASLRCIRD